MISGINWKILESNLFELELAWTDNLGLDKKKGDWGSNIKFIRSLIFKSFIYMSFSDNMQIFNSYCSVLKDTEEISILNMYVFV